MTSGEVHEQERRKAAMAVLAHASGEDIVRLMATSGLPLDAEMLRGPECGLVTVRGRIGGGGAPFNVGEASVTRATARVASGVVGHAYALGRDKEKARLAAIADALWQEPEHQETLEAKVLAPLRQGLDQARDVKRAETAATKVDFFTMVRGED
ncbi:Alpha-D-ribose 1-methylphosphonate 5-triphosphate synthase subunit PhnG [Hartmannibacter diazotrophicus]|uniref:Alpha-D-ribose 1-methylphosphonate 5-triphosphate synthase subunit PhnG n=1 Tax=Hartmannibacter diazotrophicus TaxID=1482074 RepID=A0A2C9D716_9HYPH|nr:phosphonate C-P lyase system protein PhnG [Hartmannibacter diazotrophicus]SON55315.1 Alpha-D-ribose 1-methylphosphonate 5-triphosphate synthase subunit PhnG [Hartmannibacter diazotrophicus]